MKVSKKDAQLKKIWFWARWSLCVLLGLYILLVLFRIPAVNEKERTQETIAKINAQKITIADVMGDYLPLPPNKEKNNATVAGIDANNNSIRDDVELVIFERHPDSAKIRAAELQYAMAEQLFLDSVFNIETWKVAAVEHSRAYGCIGQTISSKNIQDVEFRIKEVEDLVFNTDSRVTAKDNSYNFTTSYGLTGENLCDIDLKTLPN